MKFVFFATILASTLVTSGLEAQTIDFDDLPGGMAIPTGTPITTQFPGVTFTTEVGDCFTSGFEAASPPNGLRGGDESTNIFGNPTLSDIYMAFLPSVSRVGFTASGVGMNDLEITAYAAADVMVDQVILDRDGNGGGNRDIVSLNGAGIVRVTITQVTQDALDGYTIDDLSFVAEPVAECGNSVRDRGEVCDDGNTLNCDACASDCSSTTTPGCQVGGSCVADGAANPANPCEVCDPDRNNTTYSPQPAGTMCSDGLFCTVSDVCTAGTCAGAARDCSDALACTLDTCDDVSNTCNNTLTATSCTIAGACVAAGTVSPTNPCMVCDPARSNSEHSPASNGSTCDDGLFCSASDVCTDGVCGGSVRDCSDSLDCTTDTCDEALNSCENALTVGCLVGGDCIDDGDVDPSNPCQACAPSASSAEYTSLPTGTLCGSPSCSDSTITPAPTCRAAGECVAAEAMDCAGGVMCEDGMSCLGGCGGDAECEGSSFCNETMECVADLDVGTSCERGTQCTSGFCIDGACCNGACAGECEQCGTGECLPVAGGTDPDDECGAMSCDGSRMCEMAVADAGTVDAGTADAGVPDASADVGAGGVTGGTTCSVSPGTLPTPASAVFVMLMAGLVTWRGRRVKRC